MILWIPWILAKDRLFENNRKILLFSKEEQILINAEEMNMKISWKYCESMNSN